MHTHVLVEIEKSSVELFIIGCLGIAIHFLMKVRDQYKKGDIPWVDNFLVMTISLLIVAGLVYIREDIANTWPMTKTVTLFTGYSAQSIFLNLSASLKKKSTREAGFLFLQILSILGFALLFSSCRTEQWYTAQFYKMKSKYPSTHAWDCNSAYPVKESTSVITKYLPGKIDTSYQTIVLDCDSVVKAHDEKKGKLAPVQVRFGYPVKTVDTYYSITTETIESTAAVNALTQRLKEVEEKATKYQTLYKQGLGVIESKNGIIFKMAAVITSIVLAAAAFAYFKFR